MPATTIFSAYCACTICCGPNAVGLSADGTIPRKSKTGAAGKSIKLGTIINVKIPGNPHWQNRTITITDRIAERYASSRIDIFLGDHNAAKKFGIQKGTYTIKKPQRTTK